MQALPASQVLGALPAALSSLRNPVVGLAATTLLAYYIIQRKKLDPAWSTFVLGAAGSLAASYAYTMIQPPQGGV